MHFWGNGFFLYVALVAALAGEVMVRDSAEEFHKFDEMESEVLGTLGHFVLNCHFGDCEKNSYDLVIHFYTAHPQHPPSRIHVKFAFDLEFFEKFFEPLLVITKHLTHQHTPLTLIQPKIPNLKRVTKRQYHIIYNLLQALFTILNSICFPRAVLKHRNPYKHFQKFLPIEHVIGVGVLFILKILDVGLFEDFDQVFFGEILVEDSVFPTEIRHGQFVDIRVKP